MEFFHLFCYKIEFDLRGLHIFKNTLIDYSSLPGPHGSLHLLLLLNIPAKFWFSVRTKGFSMTIHAKMYLPEIIAQKRST